MKTLLGESNTALASLKSALKLRGSPSSSHSRLRGGGSQMAGERLFSFSLLENENAITGKMGKNEENVSGQAGVYSHKHILVV